MIVKGCGLSPVIPAVMNLIRASEIEAFVGRLANLRIGLHSNPENEPTNNLSETLVLGSGMEKVVSISAERVSIANFP